MDQAILPLHHKNVMAIYTQSIKLPLVSIRSNHCESSVLPSFSPSRPFFSSSPCLFLIAVRKSEIHLRGLTSPICCETKPQQTHLTLLNKVLALEALLNITMISIQYQQRMLIIIFFTTAAAKLIVLVIYTVKPRPLGAMQLRNHGHDFELPIIKYEFNERNCSFAFMLCDFTCFQWHYLHFYQIIHVCYCHVLVLLTYVRRHQVID